jgi:hypothetical protein
MKKVITLLLGLSVLLSLLLTAYAHHVPQEREDCSIEVIVRYDGEDVDGGTLTAIRVGYVDEEDGNYFFSQEFTNAKIEDITSSGAPKEQKKFYNNNKDNYDFYTQTQTVTDGKATFSGLSTGLYLIVQEESANGFSKMDAFLVSVPYMENGEYRYHVTAAIKSEVERETEPTDPPPTEDEDSKLPQTGQLNWPVPLMVVAGLALFVVGWVLCFGKKREQYEE